MKKTGMVLAAGMAMALAWAAVARGEVVATARSPEGKFAEFRVVLDTVGEPVAVANFMGLADGSQAWVDTATGAIRGGEGDAFYDGMVFDWHAGSMLRGGLRGTEKSDGTMAYESGPGYTITGKSEHAWDAVTEGALALVESGGPHSGGSELALFLTNGVTPWTVFGQVAPGDEAGLRALATAMGEGPTKVQWSVDAGGATENEKESLALARKELPAVEGIETRTTGAGLEWELAGKSRLGISLTTDLKEGWTYQAGAWNEREDALEYHGIGWGDLGLGGSTGFASFLGVRYPRLTGTVWSGKWRIGVEHSEQTMQYWLDFDGRTGMWAVVKSGAITDSGTLTIWNTWRETGNSLYLSFGMGLTANYYYFGFAEEEGRKGRFMSQQRHTAWSEDWGNFEMEEGWGGAAKTMRRIRRRGEGSPPRLGATVDDTGEKLPQPSIGRGLALSRVHAGFPDAGP